MEESRVRQPSGSKLGLGCWAFGGGLWGAQNDRDSFKAMNRAFDLGITHFDTASSYGKGRSEQLLGRFIKNKREKVFIASKQAAASASRNFTASIDKSLRRIGTDYIDLYYIHWPRSGMDLRPSIEALETARESGKIKYIGVSNFSVEQMEQAGKAGAIDVHQLCYNLLWRWAERDTMPYCIRNKIEIITYSSLAQGILCGKFPEKPAFKAGDHRPKTVLFDQDIWSFVYEAIEEMKEVSARADRPLAHLALRWAAEQPGVSLMLAGARNPRQVEENAAFRNGPIEEEHLDALTEISDWAIDKIPDTGNIFRYYP
jgi:myo-inositol catabolism protein IolS